MKGTKVVLSTWYHNMSSTCTEGNNKFMFCYSQEFKELIELSNGHLDLVGIGSSVYFNTEKDLTLFMLKWG